MCSASSSTSWWASWCGCARATSAREGDARRLTALVAGSASGFLTMLRTTLRLAGTPVPATPAEVVLAAAAIVGFPATDLADVVAHVEGRATLRLAARDPRAAAYLEAVARTADYVNRS